MKKMQQSYVSFVSMALVLGATFVACGGLDARKVTRGSDDTTKGGEGNDPDPGIGGMDSSAGGGKGETPFGGDKGYEGGAPPVVDGPPTVEEVNPAADADDAEPTDNIGLRFSEGLDPATVTPDSIKIMDGDVEVDGDLSYEGIDALFEPTRRLSLLATYDVSVSTDVTDAGGIAMAEPFTSKFTVRDGVWTKQSDAFDSATFSGYQDAAIAANGNYFVAYTRRVDETYNVYGRWYRVSGGWQPEVALETNGLNPFGVRVAVSPEGDAIVAWYIYEEGNYRVRVRRYASGAWEEAPQYAAQMYVTDPSNNSAPEIALAIGAGQAVVAWIRTYYDTASYYYLQMTSAGIGEAWPEYPTSNYSSTYNSPYYSSVGGVRAALDSKGNALVTFYDTSSNLQPTYGGGVYYVRKAVNGNWQYPVKIAGTDNNVNGTPVLASDGSGAMLLWSQYSSGDNKYKVMASRYTVAKQFAAPVAISDPDLTEAAHFVPSQALVSNGNAFMTTWTQWVGSARNAYATKYDVASGKWDALPTPVSDGIAQVGGESVIGIDAHGNAIVTFEQLVENYDTVVMGARYTASDDEWAGPEPLTPEGSGYGIPRISVAANGVAGFLFQTAGRDGGPNVARSGGQFRFFR